MPNSSNTPNERDNSSSTLKNLAVTGYLKKKNKQTRIHLRTVRKRASAKKGSPPPRIISATTSCIVCHRNISTIIIIRPLSIVCTLISIRSLIIVCGPLLLLLYKSTSSRSTVGRRISSRLTSIAHWSGLLRRWGRGRSYGGGGGELGRRLKYLLKIFRGYFRLNFRIEGAFE